MLFNLDPSMERDFVVVGQNRDRPLDNDRAMIDTLVDEVNGHPGLRNSRPQRLADRIEPREGGK